jgi:hypothetical protein
VPFKAHASGLGERWSEYINVDEFLRMVSTLPAKHVLVILDSCHSGMALGSGFTGSRGLDHLTGDMQRLVSRKVISSAQGDQLAADRGPLPDHSLFTGLLIQGLSSGKADNFGQGFITSNQLGSFVQHEVSVAEQSRQTPLFGTFYGDGGGDLMLPTSGDLQSLFKEAKDALARGDDAAFTLYETRAVSLTADSPQTHWLKYHRALRQRDFAKAAIELEKISYYDVDLRQELGLMPNPYGYQDVEVRLTHLQEILNAPQDNHLISVAVQAGPLGKQIAMSSSPDNVYDLHRGDHVDFDLHNVSTSTLEIGLVWISSTGEVNELGCWNIDSPARLAPGAVSSCRIRQDGVLEAGELHILILPDSKTEASWDLQAGVRGAYAAPLRNADAHQVILRAIFH